MSRGHIQTDLVLKQLAVVLQPIVRLAIRAGLTFPAFSELLKEIYVQVANSEFALAGKDQTDSRLSVITGVHRKEVRRLREAGTPVNIIPASASLSSLLISRWLSDRNFTLPDGKPRPLNRTRDDENGLGFDDLVEMVTKDVRPRAVFDDWMDRGVVRMGDDGRIHLAVEVYGPTGNADDKLYYFGRNLRDHIEAAVSNISDGDQSPFFERAVHYDGLDENASHLLMERSNNAAMTILRQVNAEARNLADKDSPDDEWRFTLGVYVFREKKPGA